VISAKSVPGSGPRIFDGLGYAFRWNDDERVIQNLGLIVYSKVRPKSPFFAD